MYNSFFFSKSAAYNQPYPREEQRGYGIDPSGRVNSYKRSLLSEINEIGMSITGGLIGMALLAKKKGKGADSFGKIYAEQPMVASMYVGGGMAVGKGVAKIINELR